MTPDNDLAKRREKARQQAYGLGIALYLPDVGLPQQHGPGERIDPGPGAVPLEGMHGHGTHGAGAEVQAKP